MVYTSAFLLFTVIYNILKTRNDFNKILWALCFMGFFASAIGLLVLANLVPLKSVFVAPISRFLPEGIRSSEYFSSILNPVFGDIIQVLGIRMKRISSLFPFPNIFAAVLIMVIPYQILLYKTSLGIKKIVLFLSLPPLLICLIWTFSKNILVFCFKREEKSFASFTA